MKAKQRGISCVACVLLTLIVLAFAVGGLRIAQAYIQYGQIESLFETMKTDPEMSNASLQEVRASFTRRASIADITAIKPEDLEIGHEGGKLLLSAEYSVKIPVVSNISLVLEFKPDNSQEQ